MAAGEHRGRGPIQNMMPIDHPHYMTESALDSGIPILMHLSTFSFKLHHSALRGRGASNIYPSCHPMTSVKVSDSISQNILP